MSEPPKPDPPAPADNEPPAPPVSDTFTIKLDGFETLPDKLKTDLETVFSTQEKRIKELEAKFEKQVKQAEESEKQRLYDTLKNAKIDIEEIQKRKPSLEALRLLVDTIPKPDGTIVISTKGTPKPEEPDTTITVYNPLTGKREPWTDRYKNS